jgi:hypothetical protein
MNGYPVTGPRGREAVFGPHLPRNPARHACTHP